jgi:hypothetical protein
MSENAMLHEWYGRQTKNEMLARYISEKKKTTIVSLIIYSRLSNFSVMQRLSPLPVTGLQT